MLRYTDKVKFIHLLEMFGKEAEVEQGRLPSEVNGCVHEVPMDEDTTYALPAESRGIGKGVLWEHPSIISACLILHV